MKAAAILPSRNEPSTIADVSAAVDTALGARRAVIVHADSSDTPETAERFAAVSTHAHKIGLTGLVRGKGAQVLAAARCSGPAEAAAVLIVDTDTRNPKAAVYRALLESVRDGAALAIADYPRHWDEANLTNHVARPLIAATTGNDVPQPLAGDLAVSHEALVTAVRALRTLPAELSECVDGYGIDAFLLLTAATCGPVVSIRLDEPKQHAGSFPHLPAIYHQAVPVLLHLTAAWRPSPLPMPPSSALYRVAARELESARLEEMLSTLDGLIPTALRRYDERSWPLPVANAWHAVNSTASPFDAARQLWPHYLLRVRDWLTRGREATTGQRREALAVAHARLHTAVLTDAGVLG
ncbi:glycosyltransferase family protein [Salinactinospora qingdaonensis]|uniref:Glycosyl transferase family 2 n=1 Tax=Salinactinospora qingdaonensis TaxID=702744 RepID=A0ABP7F7V9_9ACTN